MHAFPNSARIEVPTSLASDLLAAARRLPVRENEAYYDDDLQRSTLEGLKVCCGDELDWLLEEIRQRLARAPFSTVISGLEFDGENRLFIGLNRAFGRLVCKPLQKPRAQLVQYIHHQADITSPSNGQVYTELLHTDAADWPEQVGVVSMVCVRPDAGGEGESRLIDMHTISHEVQERFGSDVLQVLKDEPVPWLLASEFEAEVVWRPVLGQDSLCWRRYTIDFALERPEIDIPKRVIRALDALEEVTATTASAFEWLMQPGEFLMIDNRKCLHARGPVSRHRPSGRLMMRAWIRTNGKDPAEPRQN